MGSPNYAPRPNETAQDYKTRLSETGAPPLVQKAAHIIASAMGMGFYDYYSTNKEPMALALDHITEALKQYENTQGLAGARDELVNMAVAEASRRIGRNIDPKTARNLIAKKAQTDLSASLQHAVNAAWSQIRESASMEDENAPNKRIVSSFKEEVNGKLVDTDASRLVSDVLTLRESLRSVRAKK